MKPPAEISWHELPAAEVPGELESDLANGLAKAEVGERRRRFGPNKMTVRKRMSEWKLMATLHGRGDGKARVIFKKGSVERLLERCSHVLCDDGSLAALDTTSILAAVERMAARGLRVLAFARREVAHDHGELQHEHVKEGLTFLGLQGMIDPPRAEAIISVRKCQEAGIQVKMITGDHALTARSIAQQLGLTTDLRVDDGWLGNLYRPAIADNPDSDAIALTRHLRTKAAGSQSGVGGVLEPAAAPDHPVKIPFSRNRISSARQLHGITIMNPLPGIPAHVVQAPGIRHFSVWCSAYGAFPAVTWRNHFGFFVEARTPASWGFRCQGKSGRIVPIA